MAKYEDAARQMVALCPAMRARRASRVLGKVYDDELRAVGLQSSQHGVLTFVALAGPEGATIGALADELLIDRTTLTRNLRPLQKAGLLTITRSRTDARAQIVSLSKKGEKMIEKVFPLWERAYRQIAAALGPKALSDLRDQLDRATALVAASQKE